APTDVDPHCATVAPAQLLQDLLEGRDAGLSFRIVRGPIHEHADAPHPLRLLCARHERPRDSRAAEQRDQRAAHHSITSSARASSDGGTMTPSALAVGRLITSSSLVGNSTGRSPGLAPFRILTT